MNSICKRHGQIIVPLGSKFTAHPRKESDFDFQKPLPEMPGGAEGAFSMERPALVLYGHDSAPGRRVRKAELTHANVAHQADAAGRAWDLTDKCSMLNAALPLNGSYGACTAMAAPLGVGGKVVMLSR